MDFGLTFYNFFTKHSTVHCLLYKSINCNQQICQPENLDFSIIFALCWLAVKFNINNRAARHISNLTYQQFRKRGLQFRRFCFLFLTAVACRVLPPTQNLGKKYFIISGQSVVLCMGCGESCYNAACRRYNIMDFFIFNF